MARTILEMQLNRVEGDLELRVELDAGVVTDAWSAGTMYRGFENILAGRGALDGLVITPRICGICSTAHLTAAARALDRVAGAQPPPNGVRVRNLALMAEHLQSDLRHAFLTFMADFANPAYERCSLFDEAVRRYRPLRGETTAEAVRETKRIIEIIAILGGQWPHSSYMVPGGVTCVPSPGDLRQCRLLLNQFCQWYERRVIGCALDRWREVRSMSDFDAWLDQSPLHRESDLGLYVRLAREHGLDHFGRGHANFLSVGSLDLPEGTRVRGPADGHQLVPAGFARGLEVEAFDQKNVAEHVACCWFSDEEGGKHPLDGCTRPYATGREGKKYSWAKAPRYRDLPAETGPLAEAIVACSPLFVDLVRRQGPSAFARELARLVRPATLIPAMEAWLAETGGDGAFYRTPEPIVEGEGFGLIQATRGALGHWVKIADEKIVHYQIVTPTAWNASPRDSRGIRGPLEESLLGTPVPDPSNPIEVEHVVRSFDPCLVCTVHAIRLGRRS